MDIRIIRQGPYSFCAPLSDRGTDWLHDRFRRTTKQVVIVEQSPAPDDTRHVTEALRRGALLFTPDGVVIDTRDAAPMISAAGRAGLLCWPVGVAS